jgi:hypothetical protein
MLIFLLLAAPVQAATSRNDATAAHPADAAQMAIDARSAQMH